MKKSEIIPKKFANAKNRGSGFVGIVFLAIALIGIIIGAISAMSRNSASGTAEQSEKMYASIIMKQTADFKNGFDRMVINGMDPASITFNSAAGTGLFDNTPGAKYSVKHVPPSKALTQYPSSGPSYGFTQTAGIPGMGTMTQDIAVVVGPVSIGVCRQINKILYNDPVTTILPTSNGSIATFIFSDGAINDEGATNPLYKDRPEGCVRAVEAGFYGYYKVLHER